MAASGTARRVVRVDVVSDTIWPWCFVGKRRLEEAIRTLRERDIDVEVRWRPFFLDDSLPREGMSKMERYERKFGAGRVRQIIPHMQQVGKQHDPPIHFSYGGLISNTLDSHRLIEYAAGAGAGKQDAVVEALFRRYFEQEANIGSHDVLVDAATEAGLDRDAVAAFLASPAGAAEAQAEARELVRRHSISGVPHFIVGDKVGVSGAQEAPTMVQIVERVLAGEFAGAGRM